MFTRENLFDGQKQELVEMHFAKKGFSALKFASAQDAQTLSVIK